MRTIFDDDDELDYFCEYLANELSHLTKITADDIKSAINKYEVG